MQARLKNPAMMIPEAIAALQALARSVENGRVPPATLRLVHLRVSQINGCSVCVDLDRRMAKPEESGERLFMVSAWRDAPCYTDAERAALGLAEAVTRMSDRTDPVPDDVWAEAARHYDEQALATLLVAIAMANTWNRLNVPTRQVAGEWAKSAEAQAWAKQAQSAQK
jgi:AhpD family alkylhydroperoxidase